MLHRLNLLLMTALTWAVLGSCAYIVVTGKVPAFLARITCGG